MQQTQLSANTPSQGMNLDVSDYVLPDTMGRYLKNMRIVNKEGSTFIITNLKGTEEAFQITSGFVPVAEKEHNDILYLILWNETTKQLEIGSYPSPDYDGDLQGNNKYRPFDNLSNGPFRTTAYSIATKPTVDIQIQDDYDRSVNVVFTIKGTVPRIVNSKFKVELDVNGNKVYSVIPDRPGNANSNTYSPSSVEKETRLNISSDLLLGISFIGIQAGGKLKPGNYQYVFYYMTEDFNRSNVIGQSSTCQVAFGTSENNFHGGIDTQETDRRVVLQLSNVDQDFKYLKVYALYSSGDEGLSQQYLELTNPITITGANMQFIHSGFEELEEVSQEDLDIDFSVISGVDTITQINGYLLQGGIKEFTFDLAPFRAFADGIFPVFLTKNLSTAGTGGYMNPANVYNFMGYQGFENYPFGVVFVLPGGVLTPVFPIRGRVYTSSFSGTASIVTTNQPGSTPGGIVTFPHSNHYLPYESGNAVVKAIQISVGSGDLLSHGVSQPNIDYVKANSIGFFIVRGERRTSHLAQGLLLPTMKVPPIEDYKEDHVQGNNEWDPGDQGTYWSAYRAQGDSTTVFKFLIVLDSLVEAFARVIKDNDGDTIAQQSVTNEDNTLSVGYMPIFINDFKAQSAVYMENWYSKAAETWARHWAFVAGDALANEPAYITSLQRETLGINQIGKINFRVIGNITPKYGEGVTPAVSTGLWYNYETITRYTSKTIKTVKKVSFVPEESIATGTDFVSKLQTSIFYDFVDGSPETYTYHRVSMAYNSYFGVEMLEGTDGQLQDATKSSTNPIGGNSRIGGNLKTEDNPETSGTRYANLNTLVPGGFLVNIYSTPVPATAVQLYPTIDNIAYKQVSKRWSWSEPGAGDIFDVYGGDTYICKVSRKLNQSPDKNPNVVQPDDSLRPNINGGQLVTWWQESRNNLHLRRADRFDDSELEDRSFFPYQSTGDFIKYREYRLPESKKSSPGYMELLPPKSFFPAPTNAPFVENEFFSRVYASDRHIPNAFKNGFRKTTNNFRDYTSSLGRIIKLYNHRNDMLVIFERGIGAGPIEQRIQTGSDAAGAIFVEPQGVLPTNLGFHSQEIGAQHMHDTIQTPSSVYGIDRNRRVIWQLREELRSISDGVVASFLEKNNPINMRLGFDPSFNEVLFTSDNWTLVYTEGLEKFTSFYSFRPPFYARRGKELYSFVANRFHRHNADGFTIYGSEESCFVEFVINKNLNVTKVLDHLEIVSNAVPPTKVEIFTYNQEVEKTEVINTAVLNQFIRIENENDPYTGSPRIYYRDKKYTLKVPLSTIYNAYSDDDRWSTGGRMRNIYFIVRVTYDTDNLLQLASVISGYRTSYS